MEDSGVCWSSFIALCNPLTHWQIPTHQICDASSFPNSSSCYSIFLIHCSCYFSHSLWFILSVNVCSTHSAKFLIIACHFSTFSCLVFIHFYTKKNTSYPSQLLFHSQTPPCFSATFLSLFFSPAFLPALSVHCYHYNLQMINHLLLFSKCIAHHWLSISLINTGSYHVWATVKRRLCRMLLFTISLRKRRGELLGDSLGDVAPLLPPTTPGILGGSSSRCMCSLKVRMQESISTLSSLDDMPAGWGRVLCTRVLFLSNSAKLRPDPAPVSHIQQTAFDYINNRYAWHDMDGKYKLCHAILLLCFWFCSFAAYPVL